MKNLFVLILAMAFSSEIVKASGPEGKENLNVSFKSNGIVSLTYHTQTKSSPIVTILDSDNQVVFSEKISNNYGVLRHYDITAFPEGEYFFQVSDKNVKTVKGIVYSKESKNKGTGLTLDVTESADGKFKLLCKGVGDESVAITIYNKSKGLIFEETIDQTKDFSRIYDMSKLDKDNYTFEVISAERIVSKEVNLNKQELSLSK